jgi:hypothetical protein
VFRDITLRGATAPGDPVSAAILWGYRPAAQLKSWSIVRTKKKGEWAFAATSDAVEAFLIRQEPLYFAAPRKTGGFWMWPVKSKVQCVGTNQLRATLGQPEY